MPAAFTTGSGFFLAAVLAAAAVVKLRSPGALELAARRVLRPRLYNAHRQLVAQAARIIAGIELVVAIALIAGPRPVEVAGSVGAVVLCVGFVVVVGVAVARGVGCGCWGSFSTTQAGGAELARAATLAVLAVAHLAGVAATGHGHARGFTALAVGLGLAALTVAASHMGAALLHKRLPLPKYLAPRLGRDPTAVDRIVAFLLAADPRVRSLAGQPPETPLWPWAARATLARWRQTPEVLAVIAQLGAAAGRLRWRDVVVYRAGGGPRRALVTGVRVQLSAREDPDGTIVASGLDLATLAPPPKPRPSPSVGS